MVKRILTKAFLGVMTALAVISIMALGVGVYSAWGRDVGVDIIVIAPPEEPVTFQLYYDEQCTNYIPSNISLGLVVQGESTSFTLYARNESNVQANIGSTVVDASPLVALLSSDNATLQPMEVAPFILYVEVPFTVSPDSYDFTWGFFEY